MRWLFMSLWVVAESMLAAPGSYSGVVDSSGVGDSEHFNGWVFWLLIPLLIHMAYGWLLDEDSYFHCASIGQLLGYLWGYIVVLCILAVLPVIVTVCVLLFVGYFFWRNR
jgi:hypothetical protein